MGSAKTTSLSNIDLAIIDEEWAAATREIAKLRNTRKISHPEYVVLIQRAFARYEMNQRRAEGV